MTPCGAPAAPAGASRRQAQRGPANSGRAQPLREGEVAPLRPILQAWTERYLKEVALREETCHQAAVGVAEPRCAAQLPRTQLPEDCRKQVVVVRDRFARVHVVVGSSRRAIRRAASVGGAELAGLITSKQPVLTSAYLMLMRSEIDVKSEVT